MSKLSNACLAVTLSVAGLIAMTACQQDEIGPQSMQVNFTDLNATPQEVNTAVIDALVELNLAPAPEEPITGELESQPFPLSRRMVGMQNYGESLAPEVPTRQGTGSVRVDVVELTEGLTRVTVSTLPEHHPGIARVVLDRIEANLREVSR